MRASMPRVSITWRTRERLLWLSRRGNAGGLYRCVETMTLDQLEDSRRPLLFSLIPRLMRGDGTTRESVLGAFRDMNESRDRAAAMIVSSQRWRRALATSRRLAGRRTIGRKP